MCIYFLHLTNYLLVKIVVLLYTFYIIIYLPLLVNKDSQNWRAIVVVQLINSPVHCAPSHRIWRRTWLTDDALQPVTMTSSPTSCIQPPLGGDTGLAQPITAHDNRVNQLSKTPASTRKKTFLGLHSTQSTFYIQRRLHFIIVGANAPEKF